MIWYLVAVAGTLTLALVLRIAPSAMAPHGAGVDHWFWRLYIREYRRTGQFPPRLPQYILDEHQWYPPLFPLLVALLPERVLDKWSHYVATQIDLVRMSLMLAITGYLTDYQPLAALTAGLVYATTPIQISYNVQLNPRGIAALLLDILLLLVLLRIQGAGPAIWVPVAMVSALVLLTHKMTTQLMWFIALVLALVYQRLEFAALVPVSVVTAMVLSGGFYWKVLRAHWDIVSFWSRHWRWIGAHPVRESPIYGTGRYERPEKLHKSGLRGVAWHMFIMVGFNPAAWLACLLVVERLLPGSNFLNYPTPLLLWLVLPCALAALTSFVPLLKCIGAGYLYVYNTSLFASVVFAVTITYTKAQELSTAIALTALVANVAGTAIYYRQFVRNPRNRIDSHLGQLIDELDGRPAGLVMCMPTGFSEIVTFRTGRPVLWGGHGFGFEKLEPTFPRLLMPIDEVVRRYGVSYLLTLDDMVTAEFEADLPSSTLLQRGPFRLYCFDRTGGGL